MIRKNNITRRAGQSIPIKGSPPIIALFARRLPHATLRSMERSGFCPPGPIGTLEMLEQFRMATRRQMRVDIVLKPAVRGGRARLGDGRRLGQSDPS